jgi:hypothetical protein
MIIRCRISVLLQIYLCHRETTQASYDLKLELSATIPLVTDELLRANSACLYDLLVLPIDLVVVKNKGKGDPIVVTWFGFRRAMALWPVGLDLAFNCIMPAKAV